MNKYWKKRWVKALRSGEYVQGHGCLVPSQIIEFRNHYDTFCCLGVLQNEVSLARNKDFCRMDFGAEHIDKDLANQLGLSITTQNYLVEMNDYEEKSFKQIANWIEKNL